MVKYALECVIGASHLYVEGDYWCNDCDGHKYLKSSPIEFPSEVKVGEQIILIGGHDPLVEKVSRIYPENDYSVLVLESKSFHSDDTLNGSKQATEFYKKMLRRYAFIESL
ncbi:MAG: hypothetical protein WCV90_02155 [Candidatus Woesearchaeota archaeon]|jgi:hypothetical protein